MGTSLRQNGHFMVVGSAGGSLRARVISILTGFTTKKNTAAKAPPLNSRKTRTPAMINGIFDFFCATGGGNGAEGAGCVAGTSTVDAACCDASGGGGGGGVTDTGGGGGGGGAAGGLAISEVLGEFPVGPVVGPVLRGSATVAG